MPERIDAGMRASALAASSAPSTPVERCDPCVARDWSPNGSGGGVGPAWSCEHRRSERCADGVDWASATIPAGADDGGDDDGDERQRSRQVWHEVSGIRSDAAVFARALSAR